MVLGLGGMMPMPGRFLTAVVLRHRGQVTLFDCGEGTQVPLKASGFGIGNLHRFVLSHLHADHLTGVPGMLMLLAQAEPDHHLEILGLPEVNRYVRSARELLRFYLSYALSFKNLHAQGGTVRGEGFTLRYLPLDHTVPTLGFAYEEDERPGRFHIERAKELGVPEGPDWGKLQRGEAVTVGGKKIRPAQVLGEARRGRKFAYITDTAPCETALELLQGADLAVIEGMFAEEHASEAAEKKHLTVKQAATLVRDAGCARALLGHVSPRYKNNELAVLEEEARAVCDRVSLAQPLQRYEIPLPD
jgi:ribonuclease Z